MVMAPYSFPAQGMNIANIFPVMGLRKIPGATIVQKNDVSSLAAIGQKGLD